MKINFQVILKSITNLAITWDLFTWSKHAHNIIFNYFFVHLFIMIMHHTFKLFDESLFEDLLSVVSYRFKKKNKRFKILRTTQYFDFEPIFGDKKVLYITEFLVYLWFDLEVCSFPNWRFLRSSIILRRYLLTNIILEKYYIFIV